MKNHKYIQSILLCVFITVNYVQMSIAATFVIPPASGVPSNYIQAEESENQPVGTEVVRIGVNNPDWNTLHFRFHYGYYFLTMNTMEVS